ncbi:MAG: HAD family hydrolase, partial [Chloroflexota bacterium]|nr:HAD family hydrolase [Chloroflexota bacterium]
MTGHKGPDATSKKDKQKNILYAIIASLGIGALFILIHQLTRWLHARRRVRSLKASGFKLTRQGLSTPEVEARRTDEVVQARLLAEKRAKRERWRRNTFTVFNITFLVLAVTQVLLKDPWGALLTIATLFISVYVNIFQETRAAKKVDELASRTRPMAAAIRDGRLQNIDQDEIVVGDVLVAGKGDEILADGILLESANLILDESNLVEGGGAIEKVPGDKLSAGIYCETGWVVYQVSRLNIQSTDDEVMGSHEASIRIKTPLQKIIERVLYVLLVIVGIFYVIFLLEVIRIDFLPPDLLATYREVMSITFSILPTGLLLMIVINYAVGSADIARSDVLVHNSQTIEALAQISTVGFIRHGGRMGLTIQIEMLPGSEESSKFSERQIRQALGNYVHSIPREQYPLTIIKEHLDGDMQAILEQARYLSLNGWEAMTFSSANMPGSYVIGYPEVLAPYLQPETSSEPEPKQTTENKAEDFGGRLRSWFNRNKLETKPEVESVADEPEDKEVEDNLEEDDNQENNQSARSGAFSGFRKRLSGIFRRKEKEKKQPKDDGTEDGVEKERRLLFAYSTATQSLYEDNIYPHCPQNLIPLCEIKFIDEVRPDDKKAVAFFKHEGISLKILTETEPISSLAMAKQLGITQTEGKNSILAVGEEISLFSPEELQRNVIEKTIFAKMNSDQMKQTVKALQAQGEHVAVLSTSINDLEIMQTADLSITRKSSSPTVLDHADLIVLQNTFNALTEALHKGQRIVNRVMDVLKLNLTRITYTLILVVAMYISGERTFYYHPAQGGTISFFTVILPSVV